MLVAGRSARVRAALGTEAAVGGATPATRHIDRCAGFQALIPAFVDRYAPRLLPARLFTLCTSRVWPKERRRKHYVSSKAPARAAWTSFSESPISSVSTPAPSP